MNSNLKGGALNMDMRRFVFMHPWVVDVEWTRQLTTVPVSGIARDANETDAIRFRERVVVYDWNPIRARINVERALTKQYGLQNVRDIMYHNTHEYTGAVPRRHSRHMPLFVSLGEHK